MAIAVALLSGCSVAQVPATPPKTAPASARVSWMRPDAQSLDLLYVSDYETNDVDAYEYPSGAPAGVLKGILQNAVFPAGLCSDVAGDIFVPDSADSTVLVFAHGGTKPIRTLVDPNELPYSCAVDPLSGDLAVVNLESAMGPGGISFYAHAHGQPKVRTFGFIYKYYFDAYDAKGDLFADGGFDVPSEPCAFVELPRGSDTFAQLTLDQSFDVPGGVAWDGEHIVVGDSKRSTIYRFSFSGSVGTKVGSTHLARGRFVTQFLIDGATVVGDDFNGASADLWKYPAGGAPVASIDKLGEPFGVALSLKRDR
jgi:hypothetical protein